MTVIGIWRLALRIWWGFFRCCSMAVSMIRVCIGWWRSRRLRSMGRGGLWNWSSLLGLCRKIRSKSFWPWNSSNCEVRLTPFYISDKSDKYLTVNKSKSLLKYYNYEFRWRAAQNARRARRLLHLANFLNFTRRVDPKRQILWQLRHRLTECRLDNQDKGWFRSDLECEGGWKLLE